MASHTTKRGQCKDCGDADYPRGNIFTKAYADVDDAFAWVWQCNNCGATHPIRQRKRGTSITKSQQSEADWVRSHCGASHEYKQQMLDTGSLQITLSGRKWYDDSIHCIVGRNGGLRATIYRSDKTIKAKGWRARIVVTTYTGWNEENQCDADYS